MYATFTFGRLPSCLSSAVIAFKLGIFSFSLRDDRWHLPRFGRSNSLAEQSDFAAIKILLFSKKKTTALLSVIQYFLFDFYGGFGNGKQEDLC